MERKAFSKPEFSYPTATTGFEADIGKEHPDTFGNVQHSYFRADFVLLNGSMSFYQSGDCHARNAFLMTKAKSQSLPGQRNIHRALIEADFVDCIVAPHSLWT